MVFIIIIIAAAVILLFLITKPVQKYSMCPRGGPRWKNCLGYLLIRAGVKRGKTDTVTDPVQINSRVPAPEGTPEDQYNDSFVFQGADEKGNLVMTRIGFRDGGKLAEVWLWMSLNGTKFYNSNQFIRFDTPDISGLEAGGLRFQCTDKNRGQWRIEWEGALEPGPADCSVALHFTPDSKLYHSGIHMDIRAFARAMAEMDWSKQFFENLRSENQTRIEQGGTLAGSITIGGKTTHVEMRGVRDHSWGKRKWSFIKRYIWNVLSFSEGISLGGNTYRYLVYTTVNYGTSFRCLVSGWIGGDDSVLPIVAATDQAQLGEDGVIPEQFTCRFKPKGCGAVELTVFRNGLEQSWFMQNGEFEVCEAYCTFKAKGPEGAGSGVGMSEFGYSKAAGYSKRFIDG